MDARIIPLTHILRLNTKLFRNCLDGMSDEAAALRPSETTNNAVSIAVHCSDARFYLLRLVGVELPNPLAPSSPTAAGANEKPRPSLADVRDAWAAASHALRDRLEGISSDELERQVPNAPPFPGTDKSALSLLTFLVQHESYHLGQIALLRKYVGLPAVKYD